MQAAPYVIFLLIASGLSGFVAYYAWRHRAMSGAIGLAFLACAVGEWIATYALEISALALPNKLIWAKFQYIGIVSVPVAWFIFAVRYHGSTFPKNLRRTTLWLMLIPCITLALTLTNEWHNLIWTDIHLADKGAFPALVLGRGSWFWLHTAYSYVLMGIGTWLLLKLMYRTRLLYRRQTAAILVSAITPWASNALYVAQPDWLIPFDPTPFAFGVSACLLAWSFFRFRFLDLVPVAHSRIVESLPDAVIVLDPRGRIAELNAEAARLLQVPPGSVISNHIETTLPEQPALLEQLHSETATMIEIAITTDAKERIYEARLSPLHYAKSKIGGRLLILHDVTERKRDEEAQRFLSDAGSVLASSLDYETTLANIADVLVPRFADWCFIIITNPDETVRTIVLRCADPAKQTLADELVRMYPLDADAQYGYALVMRTGKPELYTSIIDADLVEVAHDERELAMLRMLGFRSSLNVPLKAHGHAVGSMMLSSAESSRHYDQRDLVFAGELAIRIGLALENAQLFHAAQLEIAERQRAEQVLRTTQHDLRTATQRAEAATHAKSELLAHMSHEIRTPITSIIGMTELLLDTGLTADQRSFAEVIHTSSDSLLSLINNLLDLSKIEAGHFDLDKHTFEIQTCIQEAIDIVAVKAVQRDLDLAFAIAPEVPPFVIGDRLRLRQILINLLGNAIKFTSRGGIFVMVDYDSAPANPAARESPPTIRLHFQVEDTGIGIPIEQHEIVFDSFRQVQSVSGRRASGTGLGLSISKQLSQLMGGDMWLESTPDVGTTLHFTIAIMPTTPSPAFAEPSSNVSLANTRFLLVGSREQTTRAIRAYAEANGALLEVAADPAEAKAILDHCDLVILDTTSGIEPGSVLNTLASANATPMLVLLASFQTPDAQIIRPAGTPVLHLPLKRSRLDAVVRQAIQTQRQCEPVQEHVQPEQHSLHILLTEDDNANREVGQKMLARLGHRVDVAASGAEALVAIASQEYDVVLLDFHLPDISGIEVAHAILQRNATKPPTLVALTAEHWEHVRAAAEEVGIGEYLNKPLRPNDAQMLLDQIAAARHGHDIPTGAIRPEQSTDLNNPYEEPDVVLKEYHPELIRTMLGTYLQDTVRHLADMRSALASNEPETMRRAAHQLKASSGLFGAVRLPELCEQLETAIREARSSEWSDLVEQIEAVNARVNAVLQDVLSHQAS